MRHTDIRCIATVCHLPNQSRTWSNPKRRSFVDIERPSPNQVQPLLDSARSFASDTPFVFQDPEAPRRGLLIDAMNRLTSVKVPSPPSHY
jgi:hypothetical protein